MRATALRGSASFSGAGFGVVAALALVAGTAPAAGQVSFVAVLEGAQEVPPVATSASGTALLTLNAAQDSLTMSVLLQGLDLDGMQTADANDNVVGLHIHRASPGANGPVVFGLVSPNSDADGDLMLDPAAGSASSVWDGSEGAGSTLAAELNELLTGGLYLNVHTTAHGGGEIRGQILQRIDSVSLEALRFRSRDKPPFDCDALHVGHVYLQRDTTSSSPLTHLLCQCVGDDSGALTHLWRALDGATDCATLVSP